MHILRQERKKMSVLGGFCNGGGHLLRRKRVSRNILIECFYIQKIPTLPIENML